MANEYTPKQAARYIAEKYASIERLQERLKEPDLKFTIKNQIRNQIENRKTIIKYFEQFLPKEETK